MTDTITRFSQLAALGLLLTVSPQAFAQEDILLHQIRRVSGIVFQSTDPQTFLVGSTNGVLSVAPNGRVERLADKAGYLTELIGHPKSPKLLFSSGYRSKTEKLGVLRSDDAGRTWSRISAGAGGPVAFHAMAISPIEPATIYGAEKKLQVSRDNGETWLSTGAPSASIFDIAASAKDRKTVYAATREGLFQSSDEGISWQMAYPERRPVTMVHVAPDGRIFAFVYGQGLLVGAESGLRWTPVSDKFADRALIDFAIFPGNSQQMLAVADTGAVMLSGDGGRNWSSFEGQLDRTPERIVAGKRLYDENCQACHGANGIGEKPDDPQARDDNGLPLAPALDDSAHAWHHADDQLIASILDGSPRNERMLPWREQGLSRDDARSLVAYIKSLWNFRSFACQGIRHMRCTH